MDLMAIFQSASKNSSEGALWNSTNWETRGHQISWDFWTQTCPQAWSLHKVVVVVACSLLFAFVCQIQGLVFVFWKSLWRLRFEELRLAKMLRDLGILTWMFSITRYEWNKMGLSKNDGSLDIDCDWYICEYGSCLLVKRWIMWIRVGDSIHVCTWVWC